MFTMRSSIKKWLKSLRKMKKDNKAHESSISEALVVQKRKVLIEEDKLKKRVDALVANIGPELGIQACTAQHAEVQAAKAREEREYFTWNSNPLLYSIRYWHTGIRLHFHRPRRGHKLACSR